MCCGAFNKGVTVYGSVFYYYYSINRHRTHCFELL